MLTLLGRISLSTIFILSGFGKFFSFAETSAAIESKGLMFAPILVVIAALFEIVGGLSVFLGWKVRWGALLLILFLIPTTYFFHDFWNQSEMQQQLIEFLKNLAIFGGLLYVYVYGAGKISVDRI